MAESQTNDPKPIQLSSPLHLLLVYEVLISGGLSFWGSQDEATCKKATPQISPGGGLTKAGSDTQTNCLAGQPPGRVCHRAINAFTKMAGLYEVSDLVGRHIFELWKAKAIEKLLPLKGYAVGFSESAGSRKKIKINLP